MRANTISRDEFPPTPHGTRGRYFATNLGFLPSCHFLESTQTAALDRAVVCL